MTLIDYYCTTAEAAVFLGVCQARIRRLCVDGRLEHRHLTARTLLVRRASVEEYAEGHRARIADIKLARAEGRKPKHRGVISKREGTYSWA